MAKRNVQARQKLGITADKPADTGDSLLMEQQIWVSRIEFRDRSFSELGRRPICLAYLKSRHAIEGQSDSPTGDVSVAETERPRLGHPVRARPSTVTGTRAAPKCDEVAARLSPARNQMYR